MNRKNSSHYAALVLGVTTASLSVSVWAIDIIAPLPEPGTMTLILGGVAAAVLIWRNRKK